MIPEVLPDVTQEIRDAVSKDIKSFQPRSNYASSLGHPCTRYGVHRRLDWERKPPISSTTQMIFEGGKVLEKTIARQYLERAGYEIVESNRPIHQNDKSGMFERLNIAGYLDFIAKKGSFEFPVEVKTMGPFDWDKIGSIEDLLYSKKTWHKTYPGQLTLYLLARNYEVGMFLFINKLTFEPKHIWVNLDMTYAEELVQRAEVIEKHMKSKTYPDRIPYDDQVCGKCEFAKVCLGDIIRTEAEILTDDILIERLERREELKVAKKEYEELDEQVKKELKAVQKGVAGNFMIIGKEVKRKGFTVDDKTIWQTSIKRFE